MQMVLLAHLDQRVRKVPSAQLDNPVPSVPLGQLAPLGPKDRSDLKVWPALKDHREHPVQSVLQVQSVQLVPLDWMAMMVQLVPKDHPDSSEALQGPQDHRVPLVLLGDLLALLVQIL